MSTGTKRGAPDRTVGADTTRIREEAMTALRAGNKHADAYHRSRHDHEDSVHTQLAAEYDAKALLTKSAGWRTRHTRQADQYRSYIGVHIDERCHWAYPTAASAVQFEEPRGVGTYDHVTFNAFDSAGVPVARVSLTGSLDMITDVMQAVQTIVGRHPTAEERVVIYPGAFPKME